MANTTDNVQRSTMDRSLVIEGSLSRSFGRTAGLSGWRSVTAERSPRTRVTRPTQQPHNHRLHCLGCDPLASCVSCDVLQTDSGGQVETLVGRSDRGKRLTPLGPTL